MPKLTPQQAREKQAARLKQSTALIAEQVQKVSVAPGVQAAKKQDKMLTNLTNAVTSGKWARRVAGVPLEDWKQSMIQKGIPRIGIGIDAAASKVESFYDDFFKHLEKVESEVAAMPDLTLEDNLNRMVHNARRNAEYKRRG